jgi:hypothetical protein
MPLAGANIFVICLIFNVDNFFSLKRSLFSAVACHFHGEGSYARHCNKKWMWRHKKQQQNTFIILFSLFLQGTTGAFARWTTIGGTTRVDRWGRGHCDCSTVKSCSRWNAMPTGQLRHVHSRKVSGRANKKTSMDTTRERKICSDKWPSLISVILSRS